MSFYNQLKSMTKENQSTNLRTSTFNSDDNTPEEIRDITADSLPLEFVKQYLRVDHNFDDVEIMVHIKSAQNYVRTYIKQPKDEPLDDGLIAPILTLVAYFYENKSPQMKSTEKLDTTFSTILNLHRRDIIGEY